MRITLDTNVLIASILTRGTCHELLEYCLRNHEVIASRFIQDEFDRTLSGKLRFTKKETREIVGLVFERIEIIDPPGISEKRLRDKDDIQILSTAVHGKCRCLVTGDRHLLSFNKVKGVDIIQPSQFWRYESNS